jgi:putative protease
MNERNRIELLAPAKSAEVGIQAIYHGADAVYIGGPKFGARLAAGNSLADIESLVKVAHCYYAKVYVALNTILTDAELEETRALICQLYQAGVDALIIQDMGITQLDLPPISLHASTQMDNRTPQKVKFLEDSGFDQVVLARELSFDEIRAISSQTSVRLEAFVHGALCVSYSGQCYLSAALCGRSANRGACAQLCRLPYTLRDAEGRTIAAHQHLLSLRDMNLSEHLRELLDAGVSSLKIEGRLKDEAYVKNVTAFYRQKLDAVLESDNPYNRTSSGRSSYTFVPCLEKSFNRGFTEYFTHGRQDVGSFVTPKSQGEPVGRVSSIGAKCLTVDTSKTLHNGDGFCFVNDRGEFLGFKANRVEGKTIYPLNMPVIEVGTQLNRNYDAAFEKELSKPTAERKIDVRLRFVQTADGFRLEAEDEDHCQVVLPITADADEAKNAERALDTIRTQLSKTGNTPFSVSEVDISLDHPCFFPASQLADWRRQLVQNLTDKRESCRRCEKHPFEQTSHTYIYKELDYRGNVHNQLARAFYARHGVESISSSYENGEVRDVVNLMTCRHCIRFSLGLCSKNGKSDYKEPFFLEDSNGDRLQLRFDCARCEMVVLGKKKHRDR